MMMMSVIVDRPVPVRASSRDSKQNFKLDTHTHTHTPKAHYTYMYLSELWEWSAL